MKKVYLSVLAALYSVALLAQGESGGAKLDVNVTKDSGGGVPSWMWIVGVLVFIVLLVALLGGRSTSRVEKTIVRD